MLLRTIYVVGGLKQLQDIDRGLSRGPSRLLLREGLISEVTLSGYAREETQNKCNCKKTSYTQLRVAVA